MTWILTVIALYGTYLNAKQRKNGFLYWMVSNSGLSVYNFTTGEYALATLFLIYLFLAVYGYLSWKKLPSEIKTYS